MISRNTCYRSWIYSRTTIINITSLCTTFISSSNNICTLWTLTSSCTW